MRQKHICWCLAARISLFFVSDFKLIGICKTYYCFIEKLCILLHFFGSCLFYTLEYFFFPRFIVNADIIIFFVMTYFSAYLHSAEEELCYIRIYFVNFFSLFFYIHFVSSLFYITESVAESAFSMLPPIVIVKSPDSVYFLRSGWTIASSDILSGIVTRLLFPAFISTFSKPHS